KPMIAAMGLLLATQAHAQFSDYQRYLTVSDGVSVFGSSQVNRWDDGRLFERFSLVFSMAPLVDEQNDIGRQLTFGLNLKLSNQAFLQYVNISSAKASHSTRYDSDTPWNYPGAANGTGQIVSELGTRKRTVNLSSSADVQWQDWDNAERITYTFGGDRYRFEQTYDAQAPWEPFALDYQQQLQLDQAGWSWLQGGAALTFLAPVTPVPEPETYALMGAGLLAVALRRRKAKRH
ncbi:MAG TPA: PEP-CTERM sorting domain-containing protein, partial [Chitinolyticbacter sp.]|nr:PEP-CTERM sorting domain-containing protein [Chitinolyticbacter sp.]